MKKCIMLALIFISIISANAQYTWVNKNLFPNNGFLEAASFAINGMGYVVGGFVSNSPLTASDQTWQYNPATDTWSQKANYPHSTNVGAFFTINGTGYLVGGYDSATGHYYSDNNAYDPIGNTWTPKAVFPEAGISAAFYFVVNGIAYVGAGNRNSNIHGVVSSYSYNPQSDSWSSIANYPGNPSFGLCTFAIDSFGYAGMGGDGNGHFYNDLYRYNPRTNSWTQMASFPAKGRFTGMTCFVVNGKGYVGAGVTEVNGTSTAYNMSDYYMYDPVANAWSPAPGLQGQPRQACTAFSFGDSAYIAGGYNGDEGVFYRYVDEFKPARGTCTTYDTTQITDTTHITVVDTTHTSVTDTLFITVTLGISPNNTFNTLEVYPNPAHNQLYINTGNYAAMSNYSLKITNPLGQTVFQSLVTQQLFSMNISTWATGVYFLQILDASNAVVETKEIAIH